MFSLYRNDCNVQKIKLKISYSPFCASVLLIPQMTHRHLSFESKHWIETVSDIQLLKNSLQIFTSSISYNPSLIKENLDATCSVA